MAEKSGFMTNKKILAAISLVTAFIVWLTISVVLRPTGETTVHDVGVNVNVQSGVLAEMGLSVIEGGQSTVDVTISGTRSVIGGVSAEDISVTPSLSGVSGAGTYELNLTASNASGKDFEVVSVSPEKLKVKFDKYADKQIPVNYMLTGEYSVPDDYIQDSVYVSPSQITITGPERDIAEIESAMVYGSLSGEYYETVSILGEITLVDAEKNPVDYNPNEIKLSSSSATIYVPIHKVEELPIYFEYTNVPEYFDTELLNCTLSKDMIKVEGEASFLDKYSSILLGYVDIRNISLENFEYEFTAELPERINSLDGEETIKATFDLTDYAETTFYTSNIKIVNVPKGYNVTSNAKQLAVKMIGPKNVINSLSAKDITVQVDLSTRDITQTGQYRIQADVFLPSGQFAWAQGSYTVTVTVKSTS